MTRESKWKPNKNSSRIKNLAYIPITRPLFSLRTSVVPTDLREGAERPKSHDKAQDNTLIEDFTIYKSLWEPSDSLRKWVTLQPFFNLQREWEDDELIREKSTQAEAQWGDSSPLERERGAEIGMSTLATPYEYTGQRRDLLVNQWKAQNHSANQTGLICILDDMSVQHA